MKIFAVLVVTLLAVCLGRVDAGPQPDSWDGNIADTIARDPEQIWENEEIAGLDENMARPWAMDEEETRVVRGVDQSLDIGDKAYTKRVGANMMYEGKQYELPGEFDKSSINNETDVDKILNEYEDQVDKELKDGLAYITTNASSGSTSYRDCQHHYQAGARVNGVYTIFPWTADTAFDVWCDFYTSTGEGWTVISKRVDGTVFFYRNFATYRAGFGSINSEFWLGLEKMRQLVHQEPYILRVDMWDCAGSHRFAQYDYFSLGSTGVNYELLIGVYSGDAGDSLSFHRYQPFSAYDSDNDGYAGNCAGLYKAGWWYNDCYESNLNGLYYNCDNNGVPPGHTGMTWKTFGGYSYSLPRVEMKVMSYS